VNPPTPVFVDDTGRRRTLARRAGRVLVLGFVGYLVLLAAGFARDPRLGPLALPTFGLPGLVQSEPAPAVLGEVVVQAGTETAGGSVPPTGRATTTPAGHEAKSPVTTASLATSGPGATTIPSPTNASPGGQAEPGSTTTAGPPATTTTTKGRGPIPPDTTTTTVPTTSTTTPTTTSPGQGQGQGSGTVSGKGPDGAGPPGQQRRTTTTTATVD
jgi:hypothetical protein